jgi:formaldehyde-activating enzyme involved in methanogenesis
MVMRNLVTGLAAALCLGFIGTSFAQSVGTPTTDVRMIRRVPPIIAKPPTVLLPKGGVQNWAAIAAVAGAVYAATEVAHHVTHSWIPSVKAPDRVINPAASVLFDTAPIR